MAGRWRDGIQSGLRSAQPAFGDVAIGTLYFVTDEGELERSTGAAWVQVAVNETGHDALDHTGLPGVVGASAFSGARVSEATGQSLTHATVAALTSNDAEVFDTDGYHGTASNTSRLTIPTSLGGKFMLGCTVRIDGNVTGMRDVSIRRNGSATVEARQHANAIYNAGYNAALSVSVLVAAVATDYFEVWAYQDSGVALNGFLDNFWIVRLGS